MDDLAFSRLSNNLRAVALERSPHTFIAEILIYEGLLGLSVLFFLIISTMFSLRKQFFHDLSYRMFLASYIFIFFVYSFFNTTYGNPFGRIYFFSILGMLNSVVVHSNMQRSLNK